MAVYPATHFARSCPVLTQQLRPPKGRLGAARALRAVNRARWAQVLGLNLLCQNGLLADVQILI